VGVVVVPLEVDVACVSGTFGSGSAATFRFAGSSGSTFAWFGFSDSLTGRENITLGGLASGMAPERLAEITDEIGEFAQLAGYLDLPMRSYSSGMRMRLASSVAVFLDPEILLIDEALTGGDAAFAEHIAEKTAQLTGEGRTIVLVTHGLSSVKMMATEAMWLHQGQVVEFGEPDEVVSKYMRYCRIESLGYDI